MAFGWSVWFVDGLGFNLAVSRGRGLPVYNLRYPGRMSPLPLRFSMGGIRIPCPSASGSPGVSESDP